jgi:hypothetical protein
MILFKGQVDILTFIGFVLGFPINKMLCLLFLMKKKNVKKSILHKYLKHD